VEVLVTADVEIYKSAPFWQGLNGLFARNNKLGETCVAESLKEALLLTYSYGSMVQSVEIHHYSGWSQDFTQVVQSKIVPGEFLYRIKKPMWDDLPQPECDLLDLAKSIVSTT